MNSNKTELLNYWIAETIRDNFLQIFCKFQSTFKKFS